MAQSECWNCGESVESDWNYCISCTMPIADRHIFDEWLKHASRAKKLKDHHIETIAEQIVTRFPEKAEQLIDEAETSDC